MDFIFAAPEIWTVSPEAEVNSVIEQALQGYSFQYHPSLENLRTALNDSQRRKPSMIIVDTDANAAEAVVSVLKETQLQDRKIPLVVVGSQKSINDTRQLFNFGLVCLLLKPLNPDEVKIRMELASLTFARHVEYTLSFLRNFGAELTSTELKILFCFLAKEEHCISRVEIMKTLWGDVAVHPKTLDVHLFNLRKKLSNVGCQIISGRGGVWTLKKTSEVTSQ